MSAFSQPAKSYRISLLITAKSILPKSCHLYATQPPYLHTLWISANSVGLESCQLKATSVVSIQDFRANRVPVHPNLEKLVRDHTWLSVLEGH